MSENKGSVSINLSGVRRNEHDAVNGLFHRTYKQVVEIAYHQLKNKLKGGKIPVFDSEDIANAGFLKFLDQAKNGKLEGKLTNRSDFWEIVTRCLLDQIHEQIKAENAQKRGGRKVNETGTTIDLAHRKVAELLSEGKTQLEIAKILDISVTMVQSIRKDINESVPKILDLNLRRKPREPQSDQEDDLNDSVI